METFGVLLIAVDQYPNPPGPLPSSDSANRLAAIVAGDRGGAVIESIVARSQSEIWDAFERWMTPDDRRPTSTIVYLVGHGTDDGLDHSFLVPGSGGTRAIRTATLASFFERDWFRRQADRGSWTLFVLDCCAADIGVINLVHELTGKAVKKPRRLSLWPATPSGASHSGSFVDALSRAVATFTENDAVIPLNELFRRMQAELGDLEAGFRLPEEAALRNPLRSPAPLVMNLDAHAELRRVIAGLPDEVRSHFLNKAQGAETGDLAWYFEGRQQEVREVCTWLENAAGGMRVVTGPAGCGKSALLGHLAVLADDELVEAYAAADLAPSLRLGPRPPSSVFDATIHLTGKTLADVLDSVYRQLDAETIGPIGGDPRTSLASIPASASTPSGFVQFLRENDRPVTVLADALDEAQEPLPIASFLRVLAHSGMGRVLVGTRRSLTEGPDRPSDASRRELLDALEAGEDEVIVIENDPEAARNYVVQRLGASGSPYIGRQATVQALADRIAAQNQPFLFARLATSELLARPTLAPDAPQLAMLEEGHAGVFGAAVHRITGDNPVAGAMLRALALGRGRGLPESGGTWVAVARALGGGLTIPDTAVRATIDAAAPYITLDAEGGQSTYRLAHRTFVEHFVDPLGFASDLERLVATALLRLVESGGGWATANYYCVRYLPWHLEAGMNLDDFAALTTDAGWLARAIQSLGVDRTVESISGGGTPFSPVAYVVQKALRRARIALSRDPRQLAGQMRARLGQSSDARLAGLGDVLAAESPYPSLLMRHGALDWMADLETTYGLVGKIRALDFGRVDDRVLLAIGVDDQIHLWDPLLGSGEPRVIDNEGRRVNALAFARLDGRPVLIVASYYDGQVGIIRDVSTGSQIGERFLLEEHVDSIVLGLLGNRLAIVTCGEGRRISAWDAQTKLPIDALPDLLRDEEIHSVSEMEGRVVAHVVRELDQGFGVWVVDVGTGADVWPEPMRLDTKLGLVAGRSTRDGFIVSGCLENQIVVTWSPKERKELHRFDATTAFGVPVRSLAVTEVDAWTGRKVIALGPDYDDTTLVKLCQIDSLPEDGDVGQFRVSGPRWYGPEIHGIFTLPDGMLAALTDSPVAVRALTSDGNGPPFDSSPDQATVAFAITGREHLNAVFMTDEAGGNRVLVRARRSTHASATAQRNDDTPFLLDEPSQWPQSVTAWGQVGDRSVIATGSLAGGAWIWDAASGRPITGPLTMVPPDVLGRGWRGVGHKGSHSLVQSLALGRHPTHGDIIAVATEGRVRLISLPGGEELPTPTDRATVITSVALGRINDEDVLVTGSKGGVLIVWGIASCRRIAALTLDRPIDRVWVVHGADAVAAQAGNELYVLDVVLGSESAS